MSDESNVRRNFKAPRKAKREEGLDGAPRSLEGFIEMANTLAGEVHRLGVKRVSKRCEFTSPKLGRFIRNPFSFTMRELESVAKAVREIKAEEAKPGV